MPPEPSATTAPPGTKHARGRRQRSGTSFALAGAILAVFLMASTAPSPMYAIYQREWGFSSTVLTLVFAVYMVGILAALLLFGSLSDHLGRRPVLLGAIALETVSLLVLAFAPGVGWLCAGRILQGLATGSVTSAVSATLLDFQPPGSGRGPLVNGIAASGGMAVGSVMAGALVQFAPAPTELSYLVLIAALVLLLLGAVAMPEPVTGRRGEPRRIPRPQRPIVPAGQGRTFALLATTMLAAWTIGGMFMSLGPSVASGLVGSNSHFVGGLTVTVLAGVGSVAQVLASGWHGTRAVRLAVPLLLLGLAAVATAVVLGSAMLLFGGSVVLGAGWGLMFMGGFRMLSALARPEQRAGTSAMIYVVAYLSAGGSSILLGYLTTLFGLDNATIVFAVAAGAFTVLAGIGSGRSR
ncbi:Predicted arabinose efflux permease, MFS family [Actinopolyspora lacussalsi subsp. righensis]|uniref:Predicted arabinose efflux permease, MFS family n=1 Tax=Actinopolyspora righensis TaxID=995060 RepID=A0A1I7BXU7_9ACTN|nr:MFS transporter [Actinopolyspora righensis]SFT91969.1 Predicted arabinose efflux permease, MFS family [Actinopolyspora righensis]